MSTTPNKKVTQLLPPPAPPLKQPLVGLTKAPSSPSRIGQLWRNTIQIMGDFAEDMGERAGEAYSNSARKTRQFFYRTSFFVGSLFPSGDKANPSLTKTAARLFQYLGVHLESPYDSCVERLRYNFYTPILRKTSKEVSLYQKIKRIAYAAFEFPRRVISSTVLIGAIAPAFILYLFGKVSLFFGNWLGSSSPYITWKTGVAFKNSNVKFDSNFEIPYEQLKDKLLKQVSLCTWDVQLHNDSIFSGLITPPSERGNKIGNFIKKIKGDSNGALSPDILFLQNVPFRQAYRLYRELKDVYPVMYTNIGDTGFFVASKYQKNLKPTYLPFPKEIGGKGGLFCLSNAICTIVAAQLAEGSEKETVDLRSRQMNFVKSEMKKLQKLNNGKPLFILGNLNVSRRVPQNEPDEYSTLGISKEFIDPYSKAFPDVTIENATSCNVMAHFALGSPAPQYRWEVLDYILVDKESEELVKNLPTDKKNRKSLKDETPAIICLDVLSMDEDEIPNSLSTHRPLLFTAQII